MKRCYKCKTEKPLTEFNTHKTKGHQALCRECQKLDKRFRRYGVTLDWYERTLEKQGSRCAICKVHKDDYAKQHKTHGHLSVDHCHTTGKPRGLLCNPCNTAIGLLKDDPEVIRAALRYVKRHKIGDDIV